MVDSWGKIVVCGDYEGDLNEIVDVLNSLQWSYGSPAGEQHEWGIEKGIVYNQPGVNRAIIALNGDVGYPSLHPIGEIFVLKDGRRCFAKDANESFIGQWEAEKNDGASDWSECTLSELSALISPHLNKGTMEFVAVHGSSVFGSEAVLLGAKPAEFVPHAHGLGGCVYHERLLVRSDGCAEWHACSWINWAGFDGWSRSHTESYEPK